MARLVGRQSVDTKITLESGSIPIYNSELRAWDTINLSAITSSIFPFTGSAEFSGSLIVSGSIIAVEGITGSLLGTASYAAQALTSSYTQNSDLLDGLNSSVFVQTGSFNNFTSSYLTDSGSFDTRILNNSGSISLLSGSYLNSSASFDTRILNNSGSIALLSGSYLDSSASFNTRILNNSGSIASLSSSYLDSSA